jgi:isoleucyl-tRNA synthetase
MSPHVPFITEYMYQNLKNVISKESKLYAESIHFLLIPDSEEKLIDPKIQVTFTDIQEIIETARKLRDSKKISLKQPIMSLTVIDKSEEKLNSMKPLVKYIEDEINVSKVMF